MQRPPQLSSLEYVPTAEFFKLPETKKDLQFFFSEYASSRKCGVFDLQADNLVDIAKKRGMARKLKTMGYEYAKELAAFELVKEKLRLLNLRVEKIDLSNFERQTNILHSFSYLEVSAIIRNLHHSDGERDEGLFNERVELDVCRLMLGERCRYEFLEILRLDYESYIKKRLRPVSESYSVRLRQCFEQSVDLEKLVDVLYEKFLHPLEQYERKLAALDSEGGDAETEKPSFPDRIIKYIDELESSDFQSGVDEIASKLEREKKKVNFFLRERPDRKEFHYKPQFALQINSESQELLHANLCFDVTGICSSIFSGYHYISSLALSELVVSPSVSESSALECLNLLYEALVTQEKSELKSVQRIKQSELTLNLSQLSGEADNTSPRRFFDKVPSPKHILASPILASPRRFRKSHSSSVPKPKKSKNKFKSTQSAAALRKLYFKKSLKELSNDVDALIPPLVGTLERTSKHEVRTTLRKNLQGYEHFEKDKKFHQKLKKEAKRVSSYEALSIELNKMINTFSYREKNGEEELNRICTLSPQELLQEDGFNSKIFSRANSRRLLGKDYHRIPESKKQRKLLQSVFFEIYQAGYWDSSFLKAVSDCDIRLLSKLQAGRFLCNRFHQIHRLVYPYLEGEDRHWITMQFSKLFPNLNQQEASDSSNSSGSGEFLTKGFSIKSTLSKKRPFVTASCHNGGYRLQHDYTFFLTRHGKGNHFAKFVFSNVITKEIGQKPWFRRYTITSLCFMHGAPLKIMEFVIRELCYQ